MNRDFRQTASRLVGAAGLEKSYAITYKSVFGAVAAYADGRLFLTCGKFGTALKLPAEICRALMHECSGAPLKYFEKGHVKKGYVVLSVTILEDSQRRNDLIRKSAEFIRNEN